MKKSLITSLALHTLILIALLRMSGGGNGNGTGDQPAGGTGTSGQENANIVNKPIEVMTVTPEVQAALDKMSKVVVEKKKTPPKKKQPKPVECELYFGGIGVTFNPMNQMVNEVHTGYPAYEAGIQPGDIVMSNQEIRGEIGTPVTIMVQRGSDIYELTLIRAKICVTLEP